MVSALDSRSEGREFDPRRSPAEAYRVTTLGKLFTHMYPCPPSSKVGTSFGWDKCTTGAVLAVGCLQAGP